MKLPFKLHIGLPGRWLRVGVLGVLGLVVLAGLSVLAYELALARVPENRAKLERLVRAHTGLDVQFNELIVRWGWYGPEAVFRGVEIGEPGRSVVLLRAPQLIVGFDAWKTVQSGQLALGRITLVAPDIDLDRSVRNAQATQQPGSAPRTNNFAVLERWRGGRIEIEGGTLRLPDPLGAADPVTVQLRRATLRRSNEDWSAYAFIFLPDRLGRTARITLEWKGNLDPPLTNGNVRFDGTRLVFAGWRDALSHQPRWLDVLPLSGGGDVSVQLDFKDGWLNKGEGRIRAQNVEFGDPQALTDAVSAPPRLHLEELRGNWKLAQSDNGWQVRVEDLAISRESGRLPTMSLEVDRGVNRIHGELSRAPASTVVRLARWFAPHLQSDDLRFGGTAHDIRFDWNAVQPAGRRLHATLRFEDVQIESKASGFRLTGLVANAVGSESDLTVQLESERARLRVSNEADDSFDNLRVSSRLQLRRAGEGGWELSSDRIALEHEAAQLFLDGTLSGAADARSPMLSLHGVLLGADVSRLQETLGEHVAANLGEAATRITAGRIEKGEFELRGALEHLLSGTGELKFTGTLELREGVLAGNEDWPDVEAIDAALRWNGARVEADVRSAQSAGLQLASVEAAWHMEGKRASRVEGQASGELQDVLEMLRKYPALREQAPQLQELVARGPAEFDFSVTVPPLENGTERQPKVRFAALLNRAQLHLAPELPALESVSGTLAFDGGRMQRSTLTGSWFGGPVTMRVSERREKETTALAIEARGMLEARQLTQLAQIEELSELSGQSPWTGQLIYQLPGESEPARIQARLNASLVGVTSRLPEPLAKAAGAETPLHLEVSGTNALATLRISLADRLRAAFRLERPDGSWRVERGSVRLGGQEATLPEEPLIALEGRVSRLDLPAYVSLWQRLRGDAEDVRLLLDVQAGQVAVAGRVFADVSLRGGTQEEGALLEVAAPAVRGVVRWPASTDRAADVELAMLQLPDRTHEGEVSTVLAAVGRAARISIGTFRWGPRNLGTLSAHLRSVGDEIVLDDMQLQHTTHQAQGRIRCGKALEECSMLFKLSSTDVATTLADFGFRPEIRATSADLEGQVQWPGQADRWWLETLTGQVHLRVTDGKTQSTRDASSPPFPLLTIPALLQATAQPAAPNVMPAAVASGELSFARLEGDFTLSEGNATTDDLHFDGDAEILVRGRAGLVARDYDHLAWILRGSERMPEAVRRFGDAPRVAAAWLRLRELIGDDANRSRTVVRLSGSWNEPLVSID